MDSGEFLRQSVVQIRSLHIDFPCPGLSNLAIFQPSCFLRVACQLGTEKVLQLSDTILVFHDSTVALDSVYRLVLFNTQQCAPQICEHRALFLNKNEESGHPCLTPLFVGKLLESSPSTLTRPEVEIDAWNCSALARVMLKESGVITGPTRWHDQSQVAFHRRNDNP
ncbi:hypothetical protein CSKR_109268 [Clonorchis sinensis]|uniref:Uncharacterized protein n=1 Tax=Clonorchis sinensis TaxID=79923 RepID=A0A3R7C4B6_CLOSI|nr:hypothetical protein CSKR_109268 [Clonorchis sinensis]